MRTRVAGILLAAGKSTRFGSPKLIHPLPGSRIPVGVQSAMALKEAIPFSIAVVNSEDVTLIQLLTNIGIQLAYNDELESGMSGSIRCAINAINTQQVTGCVIALADMPFIAPSVFSDVADNLEKGSLICAPQRNGRLGHPVGFCAELFNELLALKGDTGAKSVVEKYKDQLKVTDVFNDSIFRDIDYSEDLK